MKYKNIFLDLDDTLIDTTGNAKKTLEEIYHKYNIKRFYPEFEDFHSKYEIENDYLWELFSEEKIEKPKLLKERFYVLFEEFDDISTEEIDKINKDYLASVELKSGIIEGAFEFLDYLKDKYKKLYIISNGFTDTQIVKIKSAGMEGYFDQTIYSDSVGISKPSSEIYHYALDKTGCLAEESVMIGDNIITDIKGSLDVGMTAIWLDPTNGKTDKQGVEPSYTIQKLSEIRNIL